MAEHLELEYETVQNVVDSWDELLRLPDYDIDAGTLLFTQYVAHFVGACAW
jgi:hypothetical protein